MAELRLEPYAVQQHWRLPGADGHWEAVLAGYLETLAQRCAAVGQTVIGHIKALALFDDGGYLRVSVVAAGRPATVEGSAPPGCLELELTLNVLVYGLERATAEQITRAAADEIAAAWKGGVHHTDLSQAGHHDHPSHSQEQKERHDE